MTYLFIIFFLGTCFGSFISLITDRYNSGLSIFSGRSFCFSCNHKLSKLDLIPLFSFLSLFGKCRYCKNKIDKKLFLTEFIAGIIALSLAIKFDLILNLSNYFYILNYILVLIIFYLILIISLYDLKHFIIPDIFLVFIFLLSLVFIYLNTWSLFMILNMMVIGIILAIPFLIIFLISKGKWIGFGDIKYIFIIGIFLGIANGLSAVILAFWIGAFWALCIMTINKFGFNFFKKIGLKTEVPFGPFLSIGVFLAFYFDLDILGIKLILSYFI